MSDILKNMSVPPKSAVSFKIEQVQKYLLFNPLTLRKLLQEKNYTSSDISKASQEYYFSNLKSFEKVRQPSGYMISECIDLLIDDAYLIKNEEEMNNYLTTNYLLSECKNIELMILVFCKTINDLYIPSRKPSFEDAKFKKILMFPLDEVLYD